MTVPLALALTLSIVAAGGCASAPSSLERLATQPAEEFRGHYTFGSGGSWFVRCGAAPADSAWWVTITGAAVAQVDEARRGGRLVDGRAAYARWRAVVTLGGEVGPRGPGVPALLVREVLELRAPRADDCVAP
jgi:hypothetical protein